MTTYAYLLDLGRCIGCQACTAACKTGNELPKGTQYIDLIEKTQGTFPNIKGGFLNHRCYHCTDAACVEVCPAGALYKEDGLTRVNQKACTGCEYCVDACPFGVPVMVNGRATKCDACADVVKAGGTPWCVKTCPSHALMYGERSQIMAEARTRLEALKARYPKARIYGETEAGGLGVVMILPDDPETLDLPANPTSPMVLNAWQKVVKPATISLTGISVLFAGVAAIIARRNHVREMASLHGDKTVEGGQRTADSGQQTTDSRRQIADDRQQTTDS